MASGLRMMVTTDPSARRWMISLGRSTFQWKPPSVPSTSIQQPFGSPAVTPENVAEPTAPPVKSKKTRT